VVEVPRLGFARTNTDLLNKSMPGGKSGEGGGNQRGGGKKVARLRRCKTGLKMGLMFAGRGKGGREKVDIRGDQTGPGKNLLANRLEEKLQRPIAEEGSMPQD